MPSRRATLSLGLAAALAAPMTRRATAQDRFAGALETAGGLDQLNCLIIAQNGRTLIERAFRGPAPDRIVNINSASKTVLAAITGAAIDRGVLPGVDARLGDLAPRLIPAGADPRVEALTVADLVTMQAGLGRTSGPNYGAWVSSRDWVAYALTRPMEGTPGQGMMYSTGTTHVLGALLASVSGESLLTLARNWIGAPLGIDIAPWTRDPQGRYMGGNNMGISPRGLLAFGEAFRRDDASIVSRDWVRESWTPRTRSPFSGDDYGYGWFLAQAGGHRVAYARGYGGQMLYVVPALALTVVMTSDDSRPARSEGYAGDLFALLEQGIVPAASAG